MRSVSFLKAAIVGLMLVAPSYGSTDLMFVSDSTNSSSHDFSAFPFWQQVLTDTASAQAIPIALSTDSTPTCAKERFCVPAVWLSFLDSVRNASRLVQLNAVNQWANARPYIEDQTNWGVPDYWETPGEFLARGGDCEDFAITKYLSLVRLGFSPDDLRIVIVQDVKLHAFHAVLAVHVDGTAWLLDNQLQKAVPMASAAQYVPIYSLNERGWWLHSLPKIELGGIVIAAGATN
jgi:predicted transglutaminase-like cysteine proteinase